MKFNNKLRVVILVEISEWGGLEVHTVELVRMFVSNGHQVNIIELSSSNGGQGYERAFNGLDDRIKIIRIVTNKSLVKLGFWKTLCLLRKVEGDVCIFPKGSLQNGSWKADFAAHFVFPEYITIEHLACEPIPPKTSKRHFAGLLPGFGWWWYKLIISRRVRSLAPHKIICVSNAVKKGLIDSGFSVQKLTTIHNGVDPDRFKRSPEARCALRTAWGISPQALVFGAVGRFNPQKGFDVALQAFRSFIDRNPGIDVRLVLVGKGVMYEEMIKRTNDLQLEGHVLIKEFCDKPWEVYSAFDVFIMPSRNEGLPFALMEAMSCCVPPIAMGVGGVPEVLVHERLGWLVNPGDIQGFIAAMEEAARSGTEKLADIGQYAREHIVSYFNAAQQYSKIAHIVENI